MIATNFCDSTIRIWDANSGALIQTLGVFSDWVHSISFSPDDTQIVTVDYNGIVQVWNVDNGALLHTLEGNVDEAYSAEYNHDGTLIATASTDKTAKIWDARTGELVLTLAGHKSSVYSAKFNFDGTRIATASYDRTVKIWDTKTGALLQTLARRNLLQILAGHDYQVNFAAFSPDGKRIVTAYSDGITKIWDAETGAPLQTLTDKNVYNVTRAGFTSDQTKIITSSYYRREGEVNIRDAQSGELLHAFKGELYPGISTAINPEGTQIIVISQDEFAAKIYDIKTGELLQTLDEITGYAYSAAFNYAGTQIVAADYYGIVFVWGVE
jgi:WD40 repeat protein